MSPSHSGACHSGAGTAARAASKNASLRLLPDNRWSHRPQTRPGKDSPWHAPLTSASMPTSTPCRTGSRPSAGRSATWCMPPTRRYPKPSSGAGSRTSCSRATSARC